MTNGKMGNVRDVEWDSCNYDKESNCTLLVRKHIVINIDSMKKSLEQFGLKEVGIYALELDNYWDYNKLKFKCSNSFDVIALVEYLNADLGEHQLLS